VYAFAKELLDTRKVSDVTYKRAVAELSLTAVVELVGVLGYYGLVSMTINAFEVPLPDGAPQPFAS
jgi:4-carboxymuconolactone decarboxylase